MGPRLEHEPVRIPELPVHPQLPRARLFRAAVDVFEQGRIDEGNSIQPLYKNRLLLALGTKHYIPAENEKPSLRVVTDAYGMPIEIAKETLAKTPNGLRGSVHPDDLIECERIAAVLEQEELRQAQERQKQEQEELRQAQERQKAETKKLLAITRKKLKKPRDNSNRVYKSFTRPLADGTMPAVTEDDKDALVKRIIDATPGSRPTFPEIAQALKQQMGDVSTVTKADIARARRRVYRLEKYKEITVKINRWSMIPIEERTRSKFNRIVEELEAEGKKINYSEVGRQIGVTPERGRQLKKQRSQPTDQS